MPKLKPATYMVRGDHMKLFAAVAAEQGLSTSALLRTLVAKEVRRAKAAGQK